MSAKRWSNGRRNFSAKLLQLSWDNDMRAHLGDDSTVSDRSRIIAKAGGSAEQQENSVAAIVATGKLAARATHLRIALEVDVRCSLDGQLVLHHDATLDRLTNGGGAVSSLTLEQLRALSLGPDGHSLITLNEAWENVRGLETVVELHDSAARTLGALQTWLGGLTSSERDQIVIASENTRAISAVRATIPTVRTSATLAEGLRLLVCSYLRHPKAAPRGHVWMLPTRFVGLDLMRPELVGAARHWGDSVWAWVVDDAKTAKELFALGVDGVFTTRPEALLTQLDKPALHLG
jgi:glycerophosphoryl diester phosphodiesterase